MIFAKIKVVLVIGALLVALGVAIYFARQEEEKTPVATPQASPVAEAQLPVAGGQYVAQEGDSCSGIAKDVFYRVGDEKDIRAFSEVNSFQISQEARRRGVPYTECPIRAGETYRIPVDWVPGGVVIQTQTREVDNDWAHWKSLGFIGIPSAVAFGIVLGRAAPPLWRRLRPRHPFEVPLDYVPPQ